MIGEDLLIERVWLIDGYPDYFVGKDNKMYRIKREFFVRECQLTVIGYSKGYVLKSRFFTIKRLRTMLIKNANIALESGYHKILSKVLNK
jgi:hypothetical protein